MRLHRPASVAWPLALTTFALVGLLASAHSSPPATQAWRPLFNGKNLDGWYVFLQEAEPGEDPRQVITIEEGAIHAYKHDKNGVKVPMGYIGTRDSYSDYHLRLQYRWGKNQFKPRYLYKPDAGVYYHHVGKDVVWPEALQCQVELNGVGDLLTVGSIQIDTTIDPNNRADDWQQYLPPSAGGIAYTTTGKGVTYTRKLENYETDGWNTVEIIAKGDEAAQLVNGRLVNRCSKIRRLDPADPSKATPLTGGRILLEFEATEMFYRNIEIRSLAPDETLDQAISTATTQGSEKLP